MNSYRFVLRKFMQYDRKNTLIYLIISTLLVPIAILELVLTQTLVSRIAEQSASMIVAGTYIVMFILFAVLYLSGMLSAMKAIAQTNLTEIGLYMQERIILEKNMKFYIEDLDDTDVKDLRDNAKRMNLLQVFVQHTTLLCNLFSLLVCIAILFYYKSIYIIVIAVALLFIRSRIQSRVSKRLEQTEQKQTQDKRILQYLFRLLTDRETIQEIRVYHLYKHLKGKYHALYTKLFKEKYHVRIWIDFIQAVSSTLMIALNIAGMVLLVVVISRNQYGVSIYVMLTQILSMLMNVITSAISGVSFIKGNNMLFVKYRSFLDWKEITEESPPPPAAPTVENGPIRICVEHLTFSYPRTNAVVLNDISLCIEPGERVAVVGSNGSGKSTLVKLLLGLYPADSGSIEFYRNGHSIAPQEVQGRARVVFQDFVRLLRPIRENVAIGGIACINDNDSLIQSMERSHITSLSGSLDDYLGPEFGGRDLSGGEWQKIAIARAYLDQGTILVFDEATSALDTHAEFEQMDTFLSLSKEKTAIYVTHRLSISKLVDKIIVLEKGKVAEFGTLTELYEAKGVFYEMYQSQSSFYV